MCIKKGKRFIFLQFLQNFHGLHFGVQIEKLKITSSNLILQYPSKVNVPICDYVSET